MADIVYIDRLTGQKQVEKVYKGKAIRLLYGNRWISHLLRPSLLPLLAKWPWFSSLYGALQKRRSSAKKIAPFVKAFDIDTAEFLLPISHFQSFNDFFIRRLKPEARPITPGASVAVMPADGRYYFYQDIDAVDGFIVKGKKFCLGALLGDKNLAKEYEGGGMTIVRLCPSDYHRFHFPCDCIPGQSHLINGWLYSVNPLAIKNNLDIFTQNKRTLCELQTSHFGKVLYLEIGATNVGSIRQTYEPFKEQAKGAEKGYFEFGGSSLILLFAKGAIQFDQDLLEATEAGLEMRCLMGQQMGVATLAAHSPG
ncbi:phosphatidylserine decarboxylase [Candidatus Protochlamydia naegleriophila]|uniref:Phosphatidylserine decarboxylase proenzyme n=1 Tax=Candidatus Protochlamydia naegleriophila TaxID=389348 RepID=A0A0U5JIW9_9BACT|nr:phosphatidylserine decarboxylase [Candidatus Protochlamydia naegleriophila]CUI17925.1 phosphatidylserine decarboxylase [Candidatus Protochlamydia naegleriophila]